MFIDDILRGFGSRLCLLLLAFLGLNGVLLLRLYSVQIKGGKKHHDQISKQSIRRIRLPPTRGRIISADGKFFADSVPSYDVYFHIHELRQRNLTKTLDHVQEQMDKATRAVGRPSLLTPVWDGVTGPSERSYFLSLVQARRQKMELSSRKQKKFDLMVQTGTSTDLKNWLIRQQMLRHMKLFPALPVKVFSNLTAEELSRLNEVMPGIPGMEISTDYQRIYPMKEVGAHFVGYIGRRYPTREEVREAYYFYPERRGRDGLEKVYDKSLRGHVGHRIVRVDSFGFYHEDLNDPDPAIPGHDLLLTIDSRAQALGLNLMHGRQGALVLMEVKTGAVLALVSSPSYDISEFNRDFPKLRVDQRLPLLNRAVAGGYLPGSIVKPLISIAILENEVQKHDSIVQCPGYYQLGRRKIHCHHRSGHGPVHLLKALEVSCNPYFIDSGLKLGIDRLTPVYYAAGLGQPTGIEIPGSFSRGRLPSRPSLRNVLHRRWIESDTAYVSIGQGFISISPLQAAAFTAAIANDGKRMRPFMVRALRDPDGRIVNATRPEVVDTLPASPETLQIIKAGMYKVVHGENATAKIARSPLITLAGKTGTAEVGHGANRYKNTWFTCFGPYEDPKYALVVLVEHGKGGGSTAAPIARQFFDTYLMITGEGPMRHQMASE